MVNSLFCFFFGMIRKIIAKKRVFHYDGDIILRDHLAMERTRLTNERTFMAYIRTSLYLIVGGFAFLKVDGLMHLNILGYFCFVLSVFVVILGTFKYKELQSDLNSYYTSHKS